MAVAAGIAALGSLKSLYDLAREMRDSRDPEKLRVAAAQMFDLALAAREQTAALQEERNLAVTELAALKTEIEQLQTFDHQAENYTRESTQTGATVYREKGSANSEGKSPYFCPNCFSNKKLAIMNPSSSKSGLGWMCDYACPVCRAEMPLPRLK